MGQLTQTTTELQAIVDNSDAANVGKTSLTDGSDTTAVAFKKSGFYSLQGSSSNAPSTDRAVLISAIRDTAATGEIRYGQIAITESNGLWWNRDDGGSLGTWYAAVSTTGTQTLTNKTLTSPVLTTPQINDSAADHQYIFAGSNLVADRTVTLPLLASDDTFVFEAHTQTLTNKTLTSPVFNTGVSGTAVLNADDFTGASATTLATSESIKAYVDAQVGTVDTLAEVLANGNATDGTNVVVTAGDVITTDTISETTAAAGVTIDGVLLKDDGVNATNLEVTNIKANDGTAAGSIADSTGVVTLASSVLTTTDINGGTIDSAVIGGTTPAAITGTAITATGIMTATGTSVFASLDISGDIDVDGTANLDVVDIDGAVDMASGLTVSGATALTHSGTTLSVDRTGGAAALIELQQASTVRGYLGADSTKSLIVFNGSAAEKFSVSNAGIDVVGTATMDGLTVDGASQLNGDLTIFDATGDPFVKLQTSEQQYVLRIDNSESDVFQIRDATNSANRLAIASNGNLSLYEDTGMTPKFFWDASAESLGIGDSSPDGILDVEGSITIAGSQAGVIFNPSVTPANNNVGSVGLVSGTLNAPASANASSKISGLRVAPTTSGSFNGAGEIAGIKVETFNGQSATLATGLYVDAPTGGDVNYAAILNGGNVGIGTSSPSADLQINDGNTTRGVAGTFHMYGSAVNGDAGDVSNEIFFRDESVSGWGGAFIRTVRSEENQNGKRRFNLWNIS